MSWITTVNLVDDELKNADDAVPVCLVVSSVFQQHLPLLCWRWKNWFLLYVFALFSCVGVSSTKQWILMFPALTPTHCYMHFYSWTALFISNSIVSTFIYALVFSALYYMYFIVVMIFPALAPFMYYIYDYSCAGILSTSSITVLFVLLFLCGVFRNASWNK